MILLLLPQFWEIREIVVSDKLSAHQAVKLRGVISAKPEPIPAGLAGLRECGGVGQPVLAQVQVQLDGTLAWPGLYSSTIIGDRINRGFSCKPPLTLMRLTVDAHASHMQGARGETFAWVDERTRADLGAG